MVLLLLNGILTEPRVLRSVLLHQQRMWWQLLLLKDMQSSQLLLQHLLPPPLPLLHLHSHNQLLRLALLAHFTLLASALGIGPRADPRRDERMIC